MNIGLSPVDNAPRQQAAIRWLHTLLDNPELGGSELPSLIAGVIFIGNTPYCLARGHWAIADGYIYLARPGQIVEPLTKLGILVAIANMTGAIEDNTLVNKIATRLVSLVADSIRSVYSGFIRSSTRPTRLAINQAQFQLAAELNGSWFLANGVPVEVDESWITLDF